MFLSGPSPDNAERQRHDTSKSRGSFAPASSSVRPSHAHHSYQEWEDHSRRTIRMCQVTDPSLHHVCMTFSGNRVRGRTSFYSWITSTFTTQSMDRRFDGQSIMTPFPSERSSFFLFSRLPSITYFLFFLGSVCLCFFLPPRGLDPSPSFPTVDNNH
jgi:hypothetical protein